MDPKAPATSGAVASIVIPAYNEGRVIGRCLRSLLDSQAGPLDIVVVANGCTDDTVEVSRGFAQVRVLDVATPSKVAALNAGDEAAVAFPRIFLDADIALGSGALTALIEALSTPQTRVASPHVRFVTRGSSLPVRLFYDAYRELPYVRSGMIGLGIYGLSQAARARFGAFPDVQADDLFIQRLFAPSERLTVEGTFDVQAPRDLSNLLRVRTRVARGNDELSSIAAHAAVLSGPPDPKTVTVGPDGTRDFSATTSGTLAGLVSAVRRRPALLPAAFTYIGVVAAARLRARRAGGPTWHRDDSTR